MIIGSNSVTKRRHGSDRRKDRGDRYEWQSQSSFPITFNIGHRSLRHLRERSPAHPSRRSVSKHLLIITVLVSLWFLLPDGRFHDGKAKNITPHVWHGAKEKVEGTAKHAMRRLGNIAPQGRREENGNVDLVEGGLENVSAIGATRIRENSTLSLGELHVAGANELISSDRASIENGDAMEGTHVRNGGAQENGKPGGQVVPFVYMVHRRLDYLKQSIDSLLKSDFPRSRVPLVISHDGRIPEMISYVESLKDDFKHLVQLFHPYACHDHPNSFPGNDTSLNVGYKGDRYGNPRSEWATCAKHHWTWMMRKVWGMRFETDVDAMFFMEEDYVVSGNIYGTIVTGLNLAQGPDFFGITLDITNGGVDQEQPEDLGWIEGRFRTGPMAITKRSWDRIRAARNLFCTFDDYNWDWSLVDLLSRGIPCRVLSPSVKQVHHIGVVAGMHASPTANNSETTKILDQKNAFNFQHFQGKQVVPRRRNQVYGGGRGGNGGWGHPRDHHHCLKLLG